MTTHAMRHFLLSSSIFLATATSAAAQSGEEFFNGKVLNYIVATEAGGGYDTYGRLVAEYMQKHLPGSTFVVRNMPGAGHILGANYIYGSEADGLTIGTFNSALAYSQIAELEGIRFDLRELSWIGKAASDTRVIVVSSSSDIHSMEDLQASPGTVRFGTTGVGSSDYADMLMLRNALDLPVEIISGYGGNENEMGMRRGEIQGVVGSRSSYAPFVRDGHGRLIAEVGGQEDDVPDLNDLVTTDRGREVLRMMEAQSDIIRLTAGPPGIPEDRLEALRGAYRQALDDPELQERAEALGLPIEPLIGEDLQPLVEAQFELSPETLAFVKEIFGK